MKVPTFSVRSIVRAISIFSVGCGVMAAERAATNRTTFRRCEVGDGHVALTFDDGPHEVLTPRLLDTLKQQRVKATFFLVGENVDKHPEVVKRMVKEGHEVASHSYTHPNLGKMDEGGVGGQLTKTHQAIKTACGVDVSLFRPPYGSFTETQRSWAFSRLGYRTIIWDVDPLDWKVRDSKKVEDKILASTTSGSIVLMHDIHKSTVEAVPNIIQGLRDRGLKFTTVGGLIALEKGSVGTSSAYRVGATEAVNSPSSAENAIVDPAAAPPKAVPTQPTAR
jgi:peptidoglycan/xylan/chitin deacetylase (PgdA/CDA1 family)